MKFGLLVQHAHGYKTLPQIFNLCPGTKLLSFKVKKMKKTWVEISRNFERSLPSPGAKFKKSEATFVDLHFLFSFCENRFCLLWCFKKLNLTKRGAFSTFLRLQGDHPCACAQKRCHFLYFSKSFHQYISTNFVACSPVVRRNRSSGLSKSFYKNMSRSYDQGGPKKPQGPTV